MGRTMKDTHQAWCDDLVLALRLRDVPGPRIGEVLAEMQSHVAETGEDPRSAFGTPRQYAAEVAGALGMPRAGLRTAFRSVRRSDLVIALVCGLSSSLLAHGLWSLGAGELSVLGLPAWAATLIGALGLGACALRFVASARHPSDDAVIDPRTGADMLTFGRGRLAVLVALPLTALVLMVVGGSLTR